MMQRSFMGSLCTGLEIVLKDGSCRDKALLVELSKVQRNLHSSRAAVLGQEVVPLNGPYPEDVNSMFPEVLQQLTMTLVSILENDSDHIRHSASKALLTLSDYLHDMPSLWTSFLHILWRALKAWSGDLAKYASLREEEPSCEAATALCLSAKHSLLQQRNFTAALQALQVLHNILTNCKQEGTLKLKTFLSVCGLYIGEVVSTFVTDALPPNNASIQLQYKEEIMLGALLRLLCSVIHSMSLNFDIVKAADFMVESQILTSAQSFISKLSYHCLVPHNSSCLSHYVRHKFLMLLFRLREWFMEKPSLAITCLETLKSHADDLLGSLFQRSAQWISPLRGSPFSAFVSQSNKLKQSGASPFSQFERHAVFLVFKVVVSLGKGIHTSSKSKVLSSEERCATQMEKWLHNYLLMQIHCMGNISSSEIAEVVDGMASSFVQIFVEEDNLMLEMLLLLLDIPKLEAFSLSSNTADSSVQVAHSLLLAIFNPVRLFAVFLSMVLILIQSTKW